MLFPTHLTAAIAALAAAAPIAASPARRYPIEIIPMPPDCRNNKCFFRTNKAIHHANTGAWILEFCAGAVYTIAQVKDTIPGTKAAQEFKGSVIVVPDDFADIFRYRFDCHGQDCLNFEDVDDDTTLDQDGTLHPPYKQ